LARQAAERFDPGHIGRVQNIQKYQFASVSIPM
jgi:hypothetical protein